MRPLYAILILAIVAPGPLSVALAQDNSNIVVKAKPQDKAKKAKRVCKNFDAPTGSRVGSSRVCRTEEEWRVAEDTAQRNFQAQEQRFRAERAAIQNEQNGLPIPRAH